MTVRSILNNVNSLLSLGIDSQLFLLDVNPSLLSVANNDKTVTKLLECLNYVIDELACEYAPNLVLTEVMSKDGFVDYSQLDRQLLEVVALTDSFGSNVRYRYAVGGLMAECSGRLEITYTTPYDKVGFADEVQLSNNKINERAIAYGVCAEYCLAIGDYSAMSLWDTRYRQTLALATVKRSEKRMRERRWL